MKLTFPRTHKLEELRPHYEEFKRAYPAIFQEWHSIEAKHQSIGTDELKEIAKDIREFLKGRVEYSSNAGLTMAWMDMRTLLMFEFWPGLYDGLLKPRHDR